MEMNFENAFTYLKTDTQWKSKIITGGAISVLAAVIIFLPIISLLFGSIPLFVGILGVTLLLELFFILLLNGYVYLTSYNRIHNKEIYLPDWNNFTEIFFAGFKGWIGALLYMLPAIIISMVSSLLIFTSAFSNSGLYKGVAIFLALVLFAVVMVLCFILMIFIYLMYANFAKDLKTLSFINYKEAFGLVKNNWLNYLILLLFEIALSVIAQIGAMLLACTIIGVILIPVGAFYLGLVNADFISQFVKTKKMLIETEKSV